MTADHVSVNAVAESIDRIRSLSAVLRYVLARGTDTDGAGFDNDVRSGCYSIASDVENAAAELWDVVNEARP